MISKLFFPSSLPSLLCFSLVILVRIQSSSGDENDYEKSPACNVPFQCGSITASYPFWGAPQPQSCGAHQELQLSCNDDDHHLPTMEIKGVLYWVKSINPKAQIIRILRKDFENGICSPEYPNTTINFELFNFSGEYHNITFLYDCPPSLDPPVNFPCLDGNGVKYKAWSLLEGVNGPGACSASVVVPFPRKLNWTTMTDPSDLGQILKGGFELIWKVGGLPCKNCTKPDGNCGANSGLACPPTSAPPDQAPNGPPLAAFPDKAPVITPSSAKANWEEVLRYGFELKWKIGGMACKECTNSKGICGNDPSSNETIATAHTVRLKS